MAIGDNARELLAKAYSFERPTRLMLSLDLRVPKYLETPEDNPSFFYTTGYYNLTYRRYTRTQNINKKRYCIKSDLFPRGFMKFNNWYDFCRVAETNVQVRFIKEFTHIVERHFCVAAQNEGMIVPLAVDIAKYDEMVRPQTGISEMRYAMIYNPYKPCYGATWRVNEQGELYMIKTETEEEECD